MAAGDGGSTTSRDALAALCQIYWYPLYTYAWRLTSNTHEAQDQTQEFFVQLLEKNIVAAADPARGRFRSFLLTSFKNFLANQHFAHRDQGFVALLMAEDVVDRLKIIKIDIEQRAGGPEVHPTDS